MRKFAKKNAKLVAAVTLAVSLAAAPSAFALNTNGTSQGAGDGNKPLSFVGYEFQDGASTDKLQFNFNKEFSTIGIPAESDFANLIKIFDGDGFEVGFTVDETNTVLTGSNDDTTHYTKGAKVVLTLDSEVEQQDTLYTVQLDNLIINSNGITLGNYMKRKNLEFKFRTPVSDGGGYSNTAPYVTYVVGDRNNLNQVSWESDLTVIFDRPFWYDGDTVEVDAFKTALNSGYYKGLSPVSLGSDIYGTYEAYPAKSNDTRNVNTTFFFPMTNNGFTSPCFNRTQSSNSYTLTLPTNGSYKDKSGNTFTSFAGDGSSALSFTTRANDYPGWEQNGAVDNAWLTATPGSGTITISWYDSPITPNQDGFKVYKATSMFADDWGDPIATVTSGTSYTWTVASGSYFFRVQPYKTYTEGGQQVTYDVGLSISNQYATSPNP